MQVLKVGGNELEDSSFRAELAAAIAGMDEPVVVVHGGGRAVAAMQERLGIQPMMIDGLRVTDAASLYVAQMILSGHSNKLLVSALLRAGVRAVGLSGVDGGVLRCVKKRHSRLDLGLVGEIVEVDTGLLQLLLAEGIVPVVSPISLGLDGQIYNVNADEAAGAIGVALQVQAVSFLSNVAAVLDGDDRPIAELSPEQTEDLITRGVIRDGMVPKVRSALRVVEQGVPEARILDLHGLRQVQGTRFVAALAREEREEAVFVVGRANRDEKED